MRYKSICLASLVLAELFLAGCAGVQTSTTQNLPMVAVEKPTPNKALVTVEGTPSFAGIYKLYAVEVYDNATLVGKLGPQGKLTWLREPGRMVLTLGDSVYGGDWCLGRVHTVAAGEPYRFHVECSASLVYSIAGPGVSIEDEQTGKFLTAWKGLRKGMSSGEVSILPGWSGSNLRAMTSNAGSATIKNGWYSFHYTLTFDQGKLSNWDVRMNCPTCGNPQADLVTPIRGKILFFCPSCKHSFEPAGQE
jgi:hypothetical protein